VFAYAIDPANERDWIGGLQESRQLTDGPGGLMGLFSPLMALGVKRNVSKDLQRLKAAVERDAG
jgi:hypothetical protein